MIFRLTVQRFSIAFLTLLLLFTLGELGMRTFGIVTNTDFRVYLKELNTSNRLPNEMFTTDPLLEYRLHPSTQVEAVNSDFQIIYSINSKGIRDKEYSYEKPQGVIRVLALGDSFTFGEGVNYGDRFTDIPEKALKNFEIINSGVPGWGIDQELLFLASEGIKYNPDYIFLFLNYEDTRREAIEIKNNIPQMNLTMASPAESISLPPISRFDSSYLLSFIKYQIIKFNLKKAFEAYDKNLWGGEIKRYTGGYYNSPPALQNRTKFVIQKMADVAKGSKLIIVKIDEYSNLSYVKEITGVSGFFDLTTGLRAESEKMPLRFKYDPHFNPKTHKWIGKKLTEILENITKKSGTAGI